MAALRPMKPAAFGTLMALEPAFGVVVGLIVLSQEPSPQQLRGIVPVVLAGGAAQYGRRRDPVDAVEVLGTAD